MIDSVLMFLAISLSMKKVKEFVSKSSSILLRSSDLTILMVFLWKMPFTKSMDTAKGISLILLYAHDKKFSKETNNYCGNLDIVTLGSICLFMSPIKAIPLKLSNKTKKLKSRKVIPSFLSRHTHTNPLSVFQQFYFSIFLLSPHTFDLIKPKITKKKT